MNEPVSPAERLRDLLTAIVDDRDGDAVELLGELLIQHPELQRDYLESITMHGLLQFELNGTQLSADVFAAPAVDAFVATSAPGSRWAVFLGGVAAMAIIAVLYLGVWGARVAPAAMGVSPVGILLESRRAEWGSQSALSSGSLPGDSVPSGEMELQSGFAELQLGDGAVLALDGPTQVVLTSSAVNLSSGRVATRVPSGAKNVEFTLDGLRATLSESHAAIEVCQDGEVFFDVLVGQVELADQDRRVKLESGQRFHRTADGRSKISAASGNRFETFKRHYVNLIQDGGIEDLALVTEHHLPFGNWVGDPVRGVPAESGVVPCEGRKMGRFVSTRQTGAHADGTAELIQIMDLTQWAEEIDAGRASVVAAASFNRVAGDESTDTKFGVALIARDFASRRNDKSRVLTQAIERVLTDSDPRTWEKVTVPLVLPAGTRAIELLLTASENIRNNVDFPEFDGHFVDDVKLDLRLEPASSP